MRTGSIPACLQSALLKSNRPKKFCYNNKSPPCRPGSHVPGICAEGTFRFIRVLSSTGREPSVPFSGNGIELLHKRKKVRRRFRHKLCGRIHDIEFPQESRLFQRNDQQLSKLCIVLNRCAGKDGDAHPQCDAADQRSGITAITFRSSSESPRFFR